jgi:hypothetical protein
MWEFVLKILSEKKGVYVFGLLLRYALVTHMEEEKKKNSAFFLFLIRNRTPTLSSGYIRKCISIKKQYSCLGK